jgi:hypothetical protein
MDADSFAAEVAFGLEAADLLKPRSVQSADGKIGISEMMACREYLRRLVIQAPRSDSPPGTAARIGTYVHEGVTAALAEAHPDWRFDVALTLRLPTGLEVPGHADILIPDGAAGGPALVDVKTKSSLALIRRTGPDPAHIAQVTGYYQAAVQAGLLPAHGAIRLLYVDRSGADERLAAQPSALSGVHVWQSDYDPAVLNEATERLSDVTYAVLHHEEASRDQPREWCRRFCPFVSDCRSDDPVIERTVTDPHRAEQIAQLVQARQSKKVAEAVEKTAKVELAGVDGATADGFYAHWVTVNRQDKPYLKLDAGRVG